MQLCSFQVVLAPSCTTTHYGQMTYIWIIIGPESYGKQHQMHY